MMKAQAANFNHLDHKSHAGDQKSAAPHSKGHRRPLRSHEEQEEGEGEPWLLSYADMVTLLMCFFILFFTLDRSKSAISDPERVSKRLAKAIALDVSTASGMQGGSDIDSMKNGMSSELYKMSTDLKVVFALSQPDPETLAITFLNSNFFTPGSAELSADAKVALSKVAKKITQLRTDDLLIDVEGHTDSAPLLRTEKFASNWELSTARASAVVRYLIAAGIPGATLRASGFADQQPLVKDRDANGNLEVTAQRLNRRVEIRLRKRVNTAAVEGKSKLNQKESGGGKSLPSAEKMDPKVR